MSACPGRQLDLFDHVASVYVHAGDRPVNNSALYRNSARLAGIPDDEMQKRAPVGQSRKQHSLLKRKVRWHQQTLKKMGLLERSDRGTWRLTEAGKQKLCRIEPTVALLGYSTNLGVCIWGEAGHVFSRLDRPVSLLITSPPYLLRKPRAYGNPQDEQEYVDFICRTIEPIVRNLVPGASVVLNISNDVFEVGSPARSMYIERLLLALHDRLGLCLMDRLVWQNPQKPPGPIQWASKNRYQLNNGFEPVYWLTNDPSRIRTDNRRVLQPHTKAHIKLINAGGETRNVSSCDGAHVIRAGKSYANQTAGKIPRNILEFGHTCANKRSTSARARELGLPVHGATMPLELAKFLIQFMTGNGEDELVADPFAGWNTTGLAAEMLGRSWISTEVMREYVYGGAERFKGCNGFHPKNLNDG